MFLKEDTIIMDADQVAALKKKRTFRKFTFRGVDLDQLLDMTYEQLMGLVHARARRRFSRGGCGFSVGPSLHYSIVYYTSRPCNTE